MCEPRWTIDEHGYLAWHSGEAIWDILDVGEGIRRGHRWAEDAFDALVAAIRDAETLRQARDYAAKACPGGLRHVIDRTAFDALLDLLAPSSPSSETREKGE